MVNWSSGVKARLGAPRAMRVVDRVTAVALRIASPPYFFFTKLGPARLPSSTRSLKRMGLFPLRDHYYEPLFNDAHLTKSLTEVRRLRPPEVGVR
jgi:hypothetical protein